MSEASISPFLLDSTNVLSDDFSHLSVDDPDVSIANVDLPRISSERDTLADDDHKALDATILKTYSANRQLHQEPNLSSLLGTITNNDKRLTSLTADESEELLCDAPSVKTVLRNAWRKGAFKQVRQLGAYVDMIPFIAPVPNVNAEILWPSVNLNLKTSVIPFEQRALIVSPSLLPVHSNFVISVA
jgi:hypothetical protein